MLAVHFFLCFFIVPYIKPPSCTYIIMNERTVYFSWDAIPPSQVPGVLRGYEIKFRKYHKEKENFAIADETMSQKTVFDFKPYTWYWVEVAGFTNAVERVGPHEVFVFRMPPGGKWSFMIQNVRGFEFFNFANWTFLILRMPKICFLYNFFVDCNSTKT